MPDLISSLIQQMVIGFYPIMAGHGYLITNGDGLHFTMDAGITIITMDGFGYLIINGVRHG
jgi:hypothetical protein